MNLDSEGKRLQWIIGELGMTPYQFSKELGYKSPDTVYHIINGINKISDNFAKNLDESGFHINSFWVLKGRGEPFKFKLTQGQHGNEYSAGGRIIYPGRLDFYWVNRIAKCFADIIFADPFFSPVEESYRVEVRKCAVEGLEFIYTTYNFDKGKKYLQKYFSIILQPDWKVTCYFDFWRIEEESRRGQNLLDLSETFDSTASEQFENSLYLLLNGIVDSEINDPLFDFDYNSNFIELYRTDSR
jgi:hypothetical protein